MAIIFLLYRFLLSVSYQQFTCVVWEYIGCSSDFEDGQYMGFEEEDEEGQDTNENGKDDLEVGLFQILVSEVPLVLLFFC